MFVLSNGSIKQQLTTSLAAALLLSGIGASVACAESLSDFSESAEFATPTVSNGNSDSQSGIHSGNTANTSIASSRSSDGLEGLQQSALQLNASSNILVHAHEIDGRRAATLYVKNIPVLTFIGTEIDSLSNSGDAVSLAANGDLSLNLSAGAAPAGDILNSDLEHDPVLRASTLGEKLNAGEIDAEALSVRWNEENEGYVVTLADEDLFALDSRTVLPDTTQNGAEDALQVTNRLRRLIGNAEPVSKIEGLPEPVVEVAPVEQVAIISTNVGGASWYGPGFHGRLSASGETFNQNALTAAHRTLPFGTRVLVTNLNNGRQVTVRINDRGPYAGRRIIDLSAGAAAEIGLIDSGVATVQLDVLAD